MSVHQSSTMVGVFSDRALADQAMDALFNAGFDRSQIRYAGPGTSGSFLEDIKNLFTGPSSSGGSIVNDLTGMGLSDEEAQYYSNEYGNGNTVVAVKAPGREQEALNILHGFNAYNYASTTANTANYTTQQPSDYSQQQAYTPQDIPPAADENVVANQPDTTYQSGERTADVPGSDYQQDVQPDTIPAASNRPARDISDVPTQIVRPDAHAHEQQAYTPADEVTSPPVQPDVAPPVSDQALTPANEYRQDAVNPANQDYTTEPDRTTEPDLTPQGNPPVTVAPTPNQPYPATNTYQQDRVTPVSDQQAYPDASAGLPAAPQVPTTGSGHSTELEDLQAQIQTLQQHLEDTKTQLQTAKDRETQLRTAREQRENKLRESRQQLQDLQAELQATQAELRDTQGRIDQYQ